MCLACDIMDCLPNTLSFFWLLEAELFHVAAYLARSRWIRVPSDGYKCGPYLLWAKLRLSSGCSLKAWVQCCLRKLLVDAGLRTASGLGLGPVKTEGN